MLKLVQSQVKDVGKKGYVSNGFNLRSYGKTWQQFLNLHETIASVHMKRAIKVSELGDGVNGLYKDTERSRKQLKSAGYQQAKLLQETKNIYPPKPINNLTRSLSMPMTLLKSNHGSASKVFLFN